MLGTDVGVTHVRPRTPGTGARHGSPDWAAPHSLREGPSRRTPPPRTPPAGPVGDKRPSC